MRHLAALASAPALTIGTLLLIGCSDPAELPIADTPYAPPPASAVVEKGPVQIRREVFLVPGVTPPPNSLTGKSTPAEYNFVRVVRYRVDSDPPRPARAVAVLMPGFLGGAGSYDPMARAIVRRSTTDEAYEAWAIDRRSNLLEDQHGLDVAEVKKDPEIAMRYYFEGEPAEGKTFAGFLGQAQVDYASEWGLATTIGDLRKVIELVPQAERKSRVFLVGHSLGASIAEEYAAWDFDGASGFSELAGLVLVDGISRQEGDVTPVITEQEYREGTTGGPAGFSPPGLDAIEKTTRFISLPILNLDVYPMAATVAMRALWSPEAIVEDPYRDKAFLTLLTLSKIPKMTNRAAMGFAFDDASNGVSFAAVSCGHGEGGAITEYEGIFGKLMHPSDPDATYKWVEYDAVTPREHTAIEDISRSWYEGPSLDFAEWYFPARLSLDAQAAATLTLKTGDWPLDKFGLKAMHGAEMDLPIFGAVAGLVGSLTALDKLKTLVQNVPIGPGRPLAGQPRTNPDAFVAYDVIKLTHIDPLSGTDDGKAEVSGWYDDLQVWMAKNSPTGGATIAVQKP
jgi:pimeloyl-ACP methyl ester carboxylesterase